LTVGNEKDLLLAKIDLLKIAVSNNDSEEFLTLMRQIIAEYSHIFGEESIIEPTIKSIHDLIMIENIPEGFPGTFSKDKKFNKLCEDIINLRTFLLSVANGDLSQKLPMKGYLAGVMKTFQANLKHLTWQTQMIAEGDFTHRVHFLGDFSNSFNSMVEQLDQARTKATESENKFRYLAITDPLSGLPNRRHFFQLAEAEFNRAECYNKAVSFIMMDIDHFKKINDTFGHVAGDMVIRSVAEQMQQAIRGSDHPCRYGGEEFVVMLPDTEISDAEAVAHRIKDEIQNMNLHFDATEIRVTASLGVSCYIAKGNPHHPQTVDSVLQRADKALYAAKKSGRNRVVVADSDME